MFSMDTHSASQSTLPLLIRVSFSLKTNADSITGQSVKNTRRLSLNIGDSTGKLWHQRISRVDKWS
jgi:hypothetical protein